MAVATLTASTPAEEIFSDTFRAQAIELSSLDALTVPRAFEPIPIQISLMSAYVDAGLVPPLELIVAAPSGRHTLRELSTIPLAVLVTPDAGGTWRVTVREQAHNRWWGSIDVKVTGEPAS